MNGPCYFCTRPGKLCVKADQKDPGGENSYVCDQCWRLLQNPATALPLIRGDLAISLRGTMPENRLKAILDKYMEKLATFKRPG